VYHGLDKGVRSINLDILAYTTYGRFAQVGDVAEAVRINRGNAAEENGFFGWPLCLLLVVAAIALWRSRLSRALFFTAAFFAVMSFGDVPRFNGIERTNFNGPWHWLAKLPLFDSVVPTRLGLIVTACVGVGLALAFDRLVVDRLRPVLATAGPRTAETELDDAELDDAEELDPVPALVGSGSSDGEPAVSRSEPPPARPRGSAGPGGFDNAPRREREPFPALVWLAAFVVALVPLIPSAQPVAPRPALPALFTNGNWRTELPPHPVVMLLPGGWTDNIKLMRLSTETNFEVKFNGGYFLGPNDTDPTDKNAHFGPGERDTVLLLNEANGQLTAPDVTEIDRANMRADLKFWKATNIAIAIAYHDNVDVVRETIDKLVGPQVGPGRLVGGVWLWDVRPITGA
jgi:hypothetical protein